MRTCWLRRSGLRSALKIAVLVLAVGACGGDAPAKRAVAKPLTPGAAAPAYSATALGGEAVSFGGSAAGVTLLNVWATWCTSCREEFAELERLRVSHENAGLHVVAVSVDQGGDEKIRRFAAAQGSRFPVIHDREATITPLYGVVGLPSTYLIGKDGRVRWMLVGSFLEAKDALEKEITAALKDGA
jgi:cytochrome c biogenesis protein CcmG, thiol:disulfide interchange protein DsbE